MRLPFANTLVTHKRRAVSSGVKKQDTTLQTLIPAFVDDLGTTADHEQSYLIMIDLDDPTATINADKLSLIHI